MLFKNFNKHYQTKLYTQLKQNRSYSLNFLLFYQHNNNSTKLIINTYSHSPRLNEQKNRKESLERLKNVSRGPYETIRREKQILQQSLENHARVFPKQSIFVNIISLILTPYYPGNSISLNIRCTRCGTRATRARNVSNTALTSIVCAMKLEGPRRSRQCPIFRKYKRSDEEWGCRAKGGGTVGGAQRRARCTARLNSVIGSRTLIIALVNIRSGVTPVTRFPRLSLIASPLSRQPWSPPSTTNVRFGLAQRGAVYPQYPIFLLE